MSNPYIHEMRARKNLDKIFKNIPENGLLVSSIMRETLINYPVNPKVVKDFINLCIDSNIIELRDGVIYAKKI